MKELAILLNTLNLYAHQAHNTVSRLMFLQDHDFLTEIYTAADGAYDDVIERCIGLGMSCDVQAINVEAGGRAAKISLGNDNSTKLAACLDLEKQIVAEIEKIVRGGKISLGTETMLGDIANASEIRQYKLKQRLA